MKGNTRTKLEIPKSLKSKVGEKMKGNCVKTLVSKLSKSII
jgi:hypothetical protein